MSLCPVTTLACNRCQRAVTSDNLVPVMNQKHNGNECQIDLGTDALPEFYPTTEDVEILL